MLYKPLTACEKKSSRIRTFPMAASSNFFPSLPERHKTPFIKTSLNTLIVNVFKNTIPSHPDMPGSKNQRNRPVIPAVGALRLLPEKSSPFPFGGRPPLRNFPTMPGTSSLRPFRKRASRGSPQERQRKYAEPFKLKIADADSPCHNRPPPVWITSPSEKSACPDNRGRPLFVQPCKGKIDQPESMVSTDAVPASIPPRAFQRRCFPEPPAPSRCLP